MLLHGKGLGCYGSLGVAFSFKLKELRAAASCLARPALAFNRLGGKNKKGEANPRLALATPYSFSFG